jgi:outer membrane protein TolC
VRAAQIVVGLQEEALTGTRTVLDVLVDERQRFTTQAQLVTAERDTAIRRVQCRPRPAVIGGITQRYRDQISRGRRRADPGEFCGQTAGAEFPGYAGK